MEGILSDPCFSRNFLALGLVSVELTAPTKYTRLRTQERESEEE